MSTKARAHQPPRGVCVNLGPQKQASPAVGVVPQFADCVLKSSSGGVYYTSKAVVATSSPVFKDLLQCCGRKPSSGEIDTNQGSEARDLLEIPLKDDPDEEIANLVEHLHQPERFLKSVVPEVTKEGAQRIMLLAPIAFKYNMQGILRLIEAALAPEASLNSFITHHENDNMWATWAFACRYRLESLLKDVEAKIKTASYRVRVGLEEATKYAESLPASSADVGLRSLMRLLYNMSRDRNYRRY